MIYFIVTEAGHPRNGQWLKVSLPDTCDNCFIETEHGTIEPTDPRFRLGDGVGFRRYYGKNEGGWYEKFLLKARRSQAGVIDLAEVAWDLLQQKATHTNVLSIRHEGGQEMAKTKNTKTGNEEVAEAGLDQAAAPTDGKKARQVADRKVVTVKKLADYDNEKHGKLAKQAQGILTALDELGGSANKQDLLTKMGEHVDSVQSMAKIFQHYRAKMLELKLIEISEETKTATEDLEAA